MGIDEAGRGPVIGPLVIVGYMIQEDKINELDGLGVKDSKLILPEKRKHMIHSLQLLAEDYKVVIVEPKEIDEAVETPGTNLNWLEADKAIIIINELDPDKVFIDCPSPNVKAFKEYIRERITNDKIELVVEHKADVNYLPVGAASIIAKVTRDQEIEKIKEKYGDVGPGYPSNPITRRFVKENWNKYPELFRKSWATFKNQKGEKGQKKLDEF